MRKRSVFTRRVYEEMTKSKGLMVMSILAFVILEGCFRFPLFGPREETSTIAEHLATDFYGVYVPPIRAFIGCRWFREHEPFPEEICKGIWKLVPDDSMVLLRDSAFAIRSVQISRDFQFIAYIRETGEDSAGFSVLDAILFGVLEGDTVRIPAQGGPTGGLRPSPYTPKLFYGGSSAHWGEWLFVWRIDFRDTTISLIDTCMQGSFWILPGTKGDSVICDVTGGQVNLTLGYAASFSEGEGDSLILTDIHNGTKYYIPWTPPPNKVLGFLQWIHDRDTLIVGTFTLEPGFNPIPVGRDLWWIPDVTEHMVDLSPGGNP